MLNPLFDIGQLIYFSRLKFHILGNSLNKEIVSGFSIQKIVVEKLNDKYIYKYVVVDEDALSLIKSEEELFLTQEDCQAAINMILSNAIECLQSNV